MLPRLPASPVIALGRGSRAFHQAPASAVSTKPAVFVDGASGTTGLEIGERLLRQSDVVVKNIAEDKRKYAHVTAMWGLNQDPKGREKKLGIMRLNELVVREGIFNIHNEVAILQDLRSGRPFLESYGVPQWRR